jgi:DNA-nicking Smr family endonuclease
VFLLESRVAVTLDLHGCDAAKAREMVERLLRGRGGARRGEVAHIITGKGRNSTAGPVLRPLVGRMLAGDFAPLVAEYSKDLDEAGYLVRLR